MELNKDFVIIGIGYVLSIFFSMIGMIYGVILYFLKKDNEMYYEHSKNIIAIGMLFIILRLFVSIGSLIFLM